MPVCVLYNSLHKKLVNVLTRVLEPQENPALYLVDCKHRPRILGL